MTNHKETCRGEPSGWERKTFVSTGGWHFTRLSAPLSWCLNSEEICECTAQSMANGKGTASVPLKSGLCQLFGICSICVHSLDVNPKSPKSSFNSVRVVNCSAYLHRLLAHKTTSDINLSTVTTLPPSSPHFSIPSPSWLHSADVVLRIRGIRGIV